MVKLRIKHDALGDYYGINIWHNAEKIVKCKKKNRSYHWISSAKINGLVLATWKSLTYAEIQRALSKWKNNLNRKKKKLSLSEWETHYMVLRWLLHDWLPYTKYCWGYHGMYALLKLITVLTWTLGWLFISKISSFEIRIPWIKNIWNANSSRGVSKIWHRNLMGGKNLVVLC